MGIAEEATYLGISLTAGGVTDNMACSRVNKATQRLARIQAFTTQAGIYPPTRTRLQILQSVILPLADYGASLTPLTPRLALASERLDGVALPWALQLKRSTAVRDVARMRVLARVPSFAARRQMTIGTRVITVRHNSQDTANEANKRADRSRAALMARNLQRYVTVRGRLADILSLEGEGGIPKRKRLWKDKVWRSEATAVNANRRRTIPAMNRRHLPPVLTHPVPDVVRHRALQWYLYRYPRRTMQHWTATITSSWDDLLSRESWTQDQMNDFVGLANRTKAFDTPTHLGLCHPAPTSRGTKGDPST